MPSITEPLQEKTAALIQESALRHVAVIMDGNRRWARANKLEAVLEGHRKGVDVLKRLVEFAGKVHLEALTVYAFSTENWERGEAETGPLMDLFMTALGKELPNLHAQGVRLKFIGDLAGLKPALQARIREAETLTGNNAGLRFQVAVNYGGQDELLQAARAFARDSISGSCGPDELTADLFRGKYLYTSHLAADDLDRVDLLIRTGGEQRVSNFLPWQSAYAEFYTTATYWPDFTEADFAAAVAEFSQRQRNMGK